MKTKYEDGYNKLREYLERAERMKWLERLDDWHHRRGFPGSWVFCDLWDMHTTHEFRSIAYTRFWSAKIKMKAYASVFFPGKGLK